MSAPTRPCAFVQPEILRNRVAAICRVYWTANGRRELFLRRCSHQLQDRRRRVSHSIAIAVDGSTCAICRAICPTRHQTATAQEQGSAGRKVPRQTPPHVCHRVRAKQTRRSRVEQRRAAVRPAVIQNLGKVTPNGRQRFLWLNCCKCRTDGVLWLHNTKDSCRTRPRLWVRTRRTSGNRNRSSADDYGNACPSRDESRMKLRAQRQRICPLAQFTYCRERYWLVGVTKLP